MSTRLPLLLFCILMSCNTPPGNQAQNSTTTETNGVAVEPYGTLEDGTKVSLYTLSNGRGASMKVMNYGGIIQSLVVPDRSGNPVDVVLGFDSLAQYEKRNPFFGALVGRYGNRIGKARFVLDGETYTLAANNGDNHIHGGRRGFDKVYWEIEEVPVADGVAVKLRYTSADMEEGYPGNLEVQVTYTLTNENALEVDYKATTDKKTIVNLTQHSYFNLNGKSSDILNHILRLDADRIVAVDEKLIPTGQLLPVEGTPFDFQKPVAIGARINDDHPQLRFGLGYDHCFVLNGEGMKEAAVVYSPVSGIEMTLHTTEPGVQLYIGNFLDGSLTGKGNDVYAKRTGFCLETEHFPDSPNQESFPSVVLTPGETYHTTTRYSFSARD